MLEDRLLAKSHHMCCNAYHLLSSFLRNLPTPFSTFTTLLPMFELGVCGVWWSTTPASCSVGR